MSTQPVFQKPSLEAAKQFGHDCRPHRIADHSHASGYRMARMREVYDPVSRFDSYRDGVRQGHVLAPLLLLCFVQPIYTFSDGLLWVFPHI